MFCALNRITTVIDTMTAARTAQATRGRRLSVSPEAATISGDGVSPAASAAASGSPPANAAATCRTEDGRSWPRQRRICYKAEHTAVGTNLRFLVTNCAGHASQVFAFYND